MQAREWTWLLLLLLILLLFAPSQTDITFSASSLLHAI
jgi:Sec-independent protein translocase protein TatA